MLLGTLCLVNTAMASTIPVQEYAIEKRHTSTLEARQNVYPRVGWKFSVSGTATINDAETFGSDEQWSGSLPPTSFTLNPGTDRLYTWRQGMGGEIRAELDLRMTTFAATSQTFPNLAYVIRLYEDTDENNSDLDGQASGDITFARDGSSDHTVVNFQRRVTNTAENEPRDFVDLTFTVTATPTIVWA
jgi:hypothetical protein